MKSKRGKKGTVAFMIFLLIGISFFPMMGSSQEQRSNELILDIYHKDDTTIQISAQIPELSTSIIYDYEDKYALIGLEDEGFSIINGQAKLPKIRRMIEIPQEAEPVISVIDVVWEETTLEALNLPEKILPRQPSIHKTGVPDPFMFDESYYSTDQFMSDEVAIVFETNELRGRRFALLEIAPVQYNPVTGELRLMMSCDVTMTLPGSDIGKTIENIERYSAESYDQMMEELYANYGYYEQYASESKDPEGLLIIVHDDFNDEIAPLDTHKTGLGFSVTTTPTSVTGTTTSEIKSYIEDAYNNWAIPPVYVLLVGDTPQIPAFTGTHSGGETDTYYVTMDGPDDLFADMHIGRFPAENGAQVSIMVNKTIYYEEGDFPEINWIKNATFIASSDHGALAEETHNYCIDTHLTPNGYTSDKIYETQGGSTQDIYDSLNAGSSICIYSGHGYSEGWSCIPFSNYDVYNLNNTGMYPFVGSHACSTSTYEGTSETFSEAWVRAEDKGGIAMWGSSVSTYWDEDDVIQRRYFDAWWNDSMLRIGQFTDHGMYLAYTQNPSLEIDKFIESYNVMGDASVKIWTEDPFVPEHDIHVMNLDVADVNPHNETINVSALVKNAGNNTETNITINFTAVNVTNSFLRLDVINSTVIPVLESMQTVEVTFGWNPPVGQYQVEIESELIPDEYDIENNNVSSIVEVIYAPQIEVTPLLLSYMVPTNATDTDTITITNLPHGEAVLNYTISYAGDLGGSWISATPENGTVAVDASDVVTIEVNTTGLAEGDYAGEVVVASNDVNDPEVIVAVNLTVVYGNDFEAVSVNSPTGAVTYGSYNVNATVQNKGFYDQMSVLVNCSIFEGFLDYEEDFESGDGNYMPAGGLWEYGSPSVGPTGAHSGLYCWGTNLDGDYTSDADATLDSPEIMIPNGVSSTLSFWQYYETENYYDGGNVKISTDDGASWTLLGSYQNPYPEDAADSGNNGIPGEPCFSSDSGSWVETSFDLTSYGGETILLRWHFGSDGSVTDPGWYIDDILIQGQYGFADNVLVYSTTETVSLNAYESTDIIFTPAWVAAGGNYSIQITTFLSGDEDNSNDIVADIVSVQGPSLSFDPVSHDFGIMMNDTSDSTSFEIWNDGVGTLTYTLSESCSWLDLSSYSGDSTGEHDLIDVTVDTTGLDAGMQYSCNVSISSDGGSGIFQVTMFVVNDTTPLLDVEQLVYDRGFPIRAAIDGDWAGAQSFTPGMNMVAGADLYLRKFGTPEFDLVVQLREDGPEGTLLDSVTFAEADVGTSWDWLSVDFTDVIVDPAKDYFIVCPPAPAGVTTSFGYEWGYAFGDQYAGGSFWFTRDGGNLWRDLPSSYEFTFKTYGLL